MRTNRGDIIALLILFVFLALFLRLKGEYLVTLCGLHLSVQEWYSPLICMIILLLPCLLLPRLVNYKRIFLLLSAAVIAQMTFFQSKEPTPNAAVYKPVQITSRQCLSPEGCNLILISIDAMRPDHLAAYGYIRDTSPNIDGLAASSLLFTSAYTNAPASSAAHATLFSSLMPTVHGVRDALLRTLPQQALTFAEILKSEGYATAAFSENWLFFRILKMDKGFDLLDETVTSLPDSIAKAKAWISGKKGKNFFLFLHTSQVAPPHNPPPPYHKTFSPAYRGKLGYVISADTFRKINIGTLSVNALDVEHIRSLYDGEIKYTDYQIGQLNKFLRENDLMQNTVIVLLSAYGEALGEHRVMGAASLYEENIRVPLIILIPGIAPQIVPHRVSLTNVMPTVMAILGINVPENIAGRSVVSQLRTGGKGEGYIYVEMEPDLRLLQSAHKKCLVRGSFKFIRTTPKTKFDAFINTYQNVIYFTRERELYNLKDDPEEKKNLIYGDIKIARLLEARLNRIALQQFKTRLARTP
ncbi:MAG: sulfatase [bacterium]